ncbi:aminoglycoside phosphotransferase family protein [Gracilibacillus boraciitolerans JCM 21714]|uniref:Aminoglycoside phosphotransferase family protein n=1 Tax=Gracilibacillus boraciitolerans JCM 21714 TaxID=1298598 RepID=W4VI41_9BACI|nr:aminoglycoside phosphotransferase family protein [Gracilibacillus boraciitolerans JCM 21714]
MEIILGEEWTIFPAGGATGAAYFAQSNNKKLFLKRNSSPFLAVLSAQGIVPKLVWTKRLENGDVVTAQQWLDGKALNIEEIQHPKVANLLSKIHHSSELLDMLLRIEKTTIVPDHTLERVKQFVQGSTNARNSISIYKAIKFLESRLTAIYYGEQVVCHCDLNHHNWMLSANGELYLIDWDNARVGDPAMDIGRILQSYIPKQDWNQWLEHYGLENSKYLMRRMHWYLIVDEIIGYIWSENREKSKEANTHLHELNQLLKQINDWHL